MQIITAHTKQHDHVQNLQIGLVSETVLEPLLLIFFQMLKIFTWRERERRFFFCSRAELKFFLFSMQIGNIFKRPITLMKIARATVLDDSLIIGPFRSDGTRFLAHWCKISILVQKFNFPNSY